MQASNQMSIQVESRTDKGLVRTINEDCIATLPEQGLVVLADGMGGYSAGEVASQLAVETISSHLLPYAAPDAAAIVTAVEQANSAIISAIKNKAEYEGMATTVALAHFGEKTACFAHVGDSRIYRFRDGRITQLTVDHSMVQELVNQGMFASIQEAMDAGVKKNVLIRGVGIDNQVEVAILEQELQNGDLYLFCSDGLSDMVSDEEIGLVMQDTSVGMSGMADRLLDLALQHGGKDNVSVILVAIDSRK
jgi:protein phosphatase